MKTYPKVSYGLLFVLAILLSACSGDSDNNVSDYDTVLTIYDRDVDFGANRTYSFPDSVTHYPLDDEDDSASYPHDDQILQEIDDQMAAYGYTKEPESNDPDVIIDVASTTSDYFYYWSYYPGWYYPYYYGYYVSYAYTTGTVFIHMGIDESNDSEQIVQSIWFTALNGILNDSTGNISARITRNIDQAFAQSPYLQVNQ